LSISTRSLIRRVDLLNPHQQATAPAVACCAPMQPCHRPLHRFVVTAAAATLPCTAAWPQDGTRCATEPDPARRLACYDRLFRPDPDATSAAPPPSAPASAASAPTTTPLPVGSGSIMSRLWELDATDKRRKFVVRTHLPNFFLPLHFTSSLNRAPVSPTRPATTPNDRHRRLEAKLQVSLRAKAASDVLLPGADLWLAYTQRSLWQLWNSQESAPFRSTDYQPEAIYVLPVPTTLRPLPFGWQWRMVQAGVAHQSNGHTEPLSRSWNRMYVGAGFERGEFGLQWRVHRRLPESRDDDDNPDLTGYIGRGEILATWLPGLATAGLTWRTNLRALNRGSLQLDVTYPVDSEEPAGLRWYVQVFSGYGETLLDYNHRQSTLSLGLSLFQF
jgi:phospholipase A1/A2